MRERSRGLWSFMASLAQNIRRFFFALFYLDTQLDDRSVQQDQVFECLGVLYVFYTRYIWNGRSGRRKKADPERGNLSSLHVSF